MSVQVDELSAQSSFELSSYNHVLEIFLKIDFHELFSAEP